MIAEPIILNLGCGLRTSPAAVNIDWSIYLRLHSSRVARAVAPLLLRGRRLKAFREMEGDVVVHDLRRGIPAESGSVDAVYHSHLLEHIDRQDAPPFMAEVHRVLKPGGVHRIAVPNFALYARAYLESLEQERPNHEDMLVGLLGQSVRREAANTAQQSAWRRRAENVILGDARKRGETHQWAYDQVNLRQLLEATGFVDFEVTAPGVSQISGWADTCLETNRDGTVHKAGSLFVEARRPRPDGVGRLSSQ